MKIIYAALSEAGAREENQDSIFCEAHGGGGIFLVADGMGGHDNGKMASQTVREEIQDAWEECTVRSREKMHPFLLDATLAEALNKANSRIRRSAGEETVSGSTAVVLRVGGDGCGVLNCGDSRCLRVQKGFRQPEVCKLTEDDVWENSSENTRGLTKEAIRNHANRGKLSRAVGTETEFGCSIRRESLNGKTLFALCSDGIYKCLEEKTFFDILKEIWRGKETENALMEQADRIREMVCGKGAPDNFSLILVLTVP